MAALTSLQRSKFLFIFKSVYVPVETYVSVSILFFSIFAYYRLLKLLQSDPRTIIWFDNQSESLLRTGYGILDH
jgi:hypothetical protein